MAKIIRGISGSFAEKFTLSEIGRFYFEHRNELFLGVRNEYVNLYYKSASIAKITLVSGELRCEIACKYLNPDANPGYQRMRQSELIDIYHTIKNNIDIFYSPAEKSAQQKVCHMHGFNALNILFCLRC